MARQKQMRLLDFVPLRKEDDNLISELVRKISTLSVCEKIQAINDVKMALHDISPFKEEPVDCVIWVKSESVSANDYNPNSVAPPEMELLKTSILHDGYTQPVVTWPKGNDSREVVDGFHRNRIVRECKEVNERVMGYLPVVTIRSSQDGRNDRIASTIRHNRARGKHNVDSMSDIVVELKKRNWSDSRISKELGMDADEVLRLCQVSGLTDVFKDQDFSKSWEVEIFDDSTLDIIDESDIEDARQDDSRILHTWDKWECYPAGFYEDTPPHGMTNEDCEEKYRQLLSDEVAFRKALDGVLANWVKSCEHYLTNEKMNRIAWLGQAALCFAHGIPSRFRGGYNLLTPEQQQNADTIALEYLNRWLVSNGREALDEESAQSKTQANIY